MSRLSGSSVLSTCLHISMVRRAGRRRSCGMPLACVRSCCVSKGAILQSYDGRRLTAISNAAADSSNARRAKPSILKLVGHRLLVPENKGLWTIPLHLR